MQNDTPQRSDVPEGAQLEGINVSEMIAEIIDEETEAAAELSEEERRNKEGRARLRNVFNRMRQLMASEGGKIDHTNSLSARVEFFHLQQELFHLLEQGSEEIPAPIRFLMNLTNRMSTMGTSTGNFRVSDYVDIADYMAAEGDVEMANQMRAIAQRALDNGDDIIKPEHYTEAPKSLCGWLKGSPCTSIMVLTRNASPNCSTGGTY